MQQELKKITYHIDIDDKAPLVGQYMVFLGKRGILSVHLIREVRKVKPRIITGTAKYAIKLLPQPDLKPYVVHDPENHRVWVRGTEALPTVWMPRGKKESH